MSTRNDIRSSGGLFPGQLAGRAAGQSAMGNASFRTGFASRLLPAVGAGPGGALAYLGLVAGLLALALALAPIAGLWGLPASVALCLYAVIAIVVVAGLQTHAPRRFGIANGVTLLRAASVAFLAGIATLDAPLPAALRGVVVGIGIVGLMLDGADGWLARRGGLASRFGARFDMETDALSVLVFTLLLLRTGQAGPWVLAIGLARYIFVGVAWLWPPLAVELPQSMRRKTICVVTVTALLVALMPFVAPGPARMICAAALVVLVYSFAADCVWSVRIWRVSKTERA
jgi:phosphatidylglycerophosphate synthase